MGMLFIVTFVSAIIAVYVIAPYVLRSARAVMTRTILVKFSINVLLLSLTVLIIDREAWEAIIYLGVGK